MNFLIIVLSIIWKWSILKFTDIFFSQINRGKSKTKFGMVEMTVHTYVQCRDNKDYAFSYGTKDNKTLIYRVVKIQIYD